MKVLLAVGLALLTASIMLVSTDVNESVELGEVAFSSFEAQFSKNYETTEERDMRKRVFIDNLNFINEYNSLGKSSKMGINQFADMTDEEYRSVLGSIKGGKEYTQNHEELKVDPSVTLPEEKDWSQTEKAVTPFNIGTDCAASWAFAATKAVDYSHSIAGWGLNETDYSVQQIIDCTYKFHDGCDHGWTGDAFDYLRIYKNCQTEDYPFTGKYGECQYDGAVCKDVIVNSYMFSQLDGSPHRLQYDISLKPTTVVLDASCKAFRHYESGVVSYDDCPPDDYPNFTTLAVGYGVDEASQKKFFKMLLPWGKDFGDEGHILLEDIDVEGDIGTCGLLRYPALVVWTDDDKLQIGRAHV